MNALTLLKLEFYKSRRQYIFLIEAAVLAFLTLFELYNITHSNGTPSWMELIYSLPLMVSMLYPLTMAALASRLCEAEHKGAAFKLLETMQTPRSLFDAKLACGALHVALLCLAQTAAVLCLGLAAGCGAPPWGRMAAMAALVFAASITIFTLQLGLSLLLANQLIPLTVGVCGSFLGIFLPYFPQVIQKLLPWGYYTVPMQVGMNWDPATRVIDYYWAEFDWGGLALLGVWFVVLLALARGLFARREV